MSKIRQAFKNKKKCFIPFITGGDPNLEVSKELILAMAAAGADIIEIGIPFSILLQKEKLFSGPMSER